MLTRAQVDENDTVLITGASGGVGSAAIQLAKARGAHEVLIRGSQLQDQFGDSAVDVVIDLVGGPDWPELLNVLWPFGRYAVSGAISGPIVDLD